ncbi:MAG TPA: S8 family serine peptidase [Gaiellaceae bacterium]|nr:S8 family serine peptidase [Gaiellaceae bacterium]
MQAARALVPASLMADAEAHPTKVFNVIVQGTRGTKSARVAGQVGNSEKSKPGKAKGLKKSFTSVNGVSAELTGAQILDLAKRPGILAITPDARIRLSGQFSNDETWVDSAGVADFFVGNTLAPLTVPAIAIVDSGVQSSRLDFGGRVVKQVTMTGLLPNSPGDGRGHGTFVAGIAAGSKAGYAGAAPTAPIVSIDVMDDNGMAMTSDVIAAADWILANKTRYNIRVANFSLQSTVPASFMYDPLDKAVEKLWFNGVVVVAAAGNYGVDGLPTTVAYAPGNDPFVISVGASDTNNTGYTSNDDTAAPWSAYGYTLDGFAKPDIGAPGRYVVGPVPSLSTMPLEHPERLTSSGYMWMSGTSFSAPMVSGAAALILAKNPNWTPDKVKGALMLTARPTAAASMSRRRRAEREGRLRRHEPAQSEPRPKPVRRRRRNRRRGLRLGQLGERGHRERFLEPGLVEPGFLEPGLVGKRLLERSQLGKRVLEPGELVIGLLERCQLGSRFLGRGELERGELGSRLLGRVDGQTRRTG